MLHGIGIIFQSIRILFRNEHLKDNKKSIMGKKEVGKLSIIDLIVSILIAELAAISIEQYS